MPIAMPAGALLQHPVGHRDVGVDQLVPVVAARREGGLHIGIAELGERGLVDLHVAAAGLGERLELLAERCDRVVPELAEVADRRLQHRGVAAAKVQRARAGNRDLRDEPGVGVDELKSATLIGLVHCTPALTSATGCAPRLPRCRPWRPRRRPYRSEFAELAIEVAVVGAAAELAVGCELQPDALLQRQRLADRRILRLRQRLPVDLTGARTWRAGRAGRRTQQAADVLGAERRGRSWCHGVLPGAVRKRGTTRLGG